MIKKRRRYYYPSPLAIDKFNTQVLKALSIKLSRDYGNFFKALSDQYTRGPLKKRLIITTTLLDKSLSILNNMITTTNVSKDEVETLMSNVDEINEDRDYYIEQAEQNKSLSQKIDKVEIETGISSQDLNVTKEIIKKGASQTRRRSREGVAPFLQRTAPDAMHLGAELGKGALGAALGPFAPIAGMVGTMAKGVYGVGKGLREKSVARKEAQLSGKLAPMAQSMDRSVLEKVAGARGQGQPIVGGFKGASTRGVTKQSKEQAAAALTYFFDKKAHKAKWTKEMSNRFKTIEKSIRKSGKSGGLGGFGIAGLIGKIALFTAGIAAATLSIYKIKQAVDVVGDYFKAKKGLKEAKATMKVAAGPDSAWEKHLLSQDDPLAALQKVKMSGKLAPQMAQQLEKRMTPEYVDAHKSSEKWTSQADEAKNLAQKLKGNEGLLEDMPQRTRDPFKSDIEMKEGLKNIVQAVEKVTDSLSKQQSSGVKGASLGDPFGLGSPFTQSLSSGNLSMGDD